MARKPTIYPELIKPGDWQVEEWRPDGTGTPCPCTDNDGRRMFVPAGHGKFAKEVRFHELLHVKYSPDGCPEIPGVSQASLLSAEDCRVNLLGTMIRPHDALDATRMPDPFQLLTTKTERGMAQLTAACLGYTSADAFFDRLVGGFEKIRRVPDIPVWLRSHALKLGRAVEAVRANAPGFIHASRPTFNDTITLARWLDEWFSDTSPAPPEEADPDGNEEYDEAPEEGGNAENAHWGEMSIEAPPLTAVHPNAIGRRTSASAKGSRIRHINRMVSGEIFGRTRKQATPDAVLIDDSGSMHWDEEKFYDLVKRLPVGVIAAYSGDGGTGVLRILARDGRMVAPELISTPYGGNEVDGPALRWLAEQRGRKVWVSDQGVCATVCSDKQALLADCKAVAKAAGIRTCLTTDPAEIMRALKGR